MIKIQSTKNLFNPNTRWLQLIYGANGEGKTTFAATLNDITLKYFGKPTLVVAIEPSDGGGLLSVAAKNIDYIVPREYKDLLEILAFLRTDTKYAGVVFDSLTEVTKKFVRDKALKLPAKEAKSEVLSAARAEGIPTQSDYGTMGSIFGNFLREVVALSSFDVLGDKAKHVICTAVKKEKRDKEGVLEKEGPDIPGEMATTCTSLFNVVSRIVMGHRVDPTTKTRVPHRTLCSVGDAIRTLKDRTQILGENAPMDMNLIWPMWLQKVEEQNKLSLANSPTV